MAFFFVCFEHAVIQEALIKQTYDTVKAFTDDIICVIDAQIAICRQNSDANHRFARLRYVQLEAVTCLRELDAKVRKKKLKYGGLRLVVPDEKLNKEPLALSASASASDSSSSSCANTASSFDEANRVQLINVLSSLRTVSVSANQDLVQASPKFLFDVFFVPVDVPQFALTGYYDVITHPTDLGTVKVNNHHVLKTRRKKKKIFFF